MKKEELKVNDRVKFKHHSGEIYTGTISSIWLNIFNINVDKSFGGGFVTVGGTKIVSKLEKEEKIKEIPIKQEVPLLCSYMPESRYYCKTCNKYLFGSPGGTGTDYYECDCEDCEEKNKSKSFSFDIYITTCNKYYVGGKPVTTISGCSTHNHQPFENLLAPEWLDFNKKYTIEIKEKP